MNCNTAQRLIRTLLAMLIVATVSQNADSAEPPVHWLHAGVLAPGMIGAAQLQRGGPLAGYFQPVEIRAPKLSEVSVAADGQFIACQPGPVETAMLIGSVYRLRVTGIPG